MLTSNLYYAFSCSCLNAFLSSIKKNGKYIKKSIPKERNQITNRGTPPWKNAVTNPGVTHGIEIVGLNETGINFNNPNTRSPFTGAENIIGIR